MPKGNRYDAEHLRNISSYQRQIDEIFKRAAEEAARIAESSGAEHDPDKVFSFDDYPSVRKRVDKMTSDLSSRVERTIVNGIKAQWDLSNRKNDDLVETVTGLKADDFPSDQRKRYFGTNESARRAFLDRREKGLSLSDKVWKQSERFRKDMELGIDVSLGEGMSADELGRRLRGYLNHPETLFRRVRDERGNLVLSKNAAVFHPGRGVYRSSYMNARRLAATETNMAYRSADYERWKSLDFVVGIEIQTSNNHTTKDSKGKPQPLEDICDTLAGRYPKGFKFVGWHPHCRCIATTILKTEEEMAKDTERIMNGEEPLSPSSSRNYIGGLPDKFTKWLDKNSERIENAKSLPYFLKDNEGLINGATANAGGGGSNGVGGNTLAAGGGGGNGNGNGSNGGGYNGGNVQLDDDEIRRRVHEAFADIGETIDDKDIKIEDGYVCLTAEQAKKLSAGQPITRYEEETLKNYVGTEASYTLNDSMRFDINQKYNPLPSTTPIEKATDRMTQFTPKMIETTKMLDSLISRSKLNFPVRVIRMVGLESVENMAGLRSAPFKPPYSKDVAGTYNKLQQLGNFTMQEGGYMSVSFDPNFNAMGNRYAMLVIDLPAGTNIYVTKNGSESEGILGRDRQLLPKRLDTGEIQYFKKTHDVLKIYCRPK